MGHWYLRDLSEEMTLSWPHQLTIQESDQQTVEKGRGGGLGTTEDIVATECLEQ